MGRLWHNSDETLSATVVSGGVCYHLIVEPLPQEDRWDWTIWHPGDTPAAARHGDASSAEIAIQAAKAAIRHWDDNATSGLSAAA
jgi:hypothetical protein